MRKDVGDIKEGVQCVELSSGHCLYYVDQATLDKNVKERGYQGDPSLEQITHSDRTIGIYEGELHCFRSDNCFKVCITSSLIFHICEGYDSAV